jgi:hypothetical protein
MKEISEFPSSVFEQLKYYVYLLKDPINDEIFYVGKGTGNRIFSHLNFALANPDRSDKLNKIRAIRRRGEEVEHIILRHGLSENEALEVEAAILDFVDFLEIEGLTNLVKGRESEERGYMTASDIIAQYAAKRIDISEPCILVRVNRLYKIGMNADDLYEISRGNWVLGERRNKAKYAFSVYRHVVREVYKINRWFQVPARDKEMKTRIRWRFDGEVADDLSHYIFGDISHYISKGSLNPVKYLNC